MTEAQLCRLCPDHFAGSPAGGGDMGSWLSSAFKKITGNKLSNVVGAVAPIAGSLIGGPVGAVVGGLLSPSPQSLPPQTSPPPPPAPKSDSALPVLVFGLIALMAMRQGGRRRG